MNWLRRILRSSARFSNGEFSLRLIPVFRECLRVRYQRGAIARDLNAEYIGRRWGALDVRVPLSLEPEDLRNLVEDLRIGLQAMGKEYVITQAEDPIAVPEEEKQRAIAKLSDRI